MMYRNSPRLGTIIVPKRKEQAFPTFVYQYAPKIDPNLGETGTWNGSLLKEKGMALSFTVVNIVYRKVPIF